MKRTLMLICGWWIYASSFAQGQISISTDKTTSLVFPFPVRNVDVGTKDVLVQQVKEAGNLLLVKAGIVNFKATNISVVTSDGQVYSIDVRFEECLDETIHYIQPKTERLVMFTGKSMNQADLRAYATAILDNPKHIWGVRNRKWDMMARVNGIYVKDGVMFFQLKVDNLSPVDYDIDFVRFYIRDTRKLKRTAVQEIELTPLCKTGNINKVTAYNNSVSVFALEKFTIPEAKHLVIELGEKNGGRHLKLKIGNSKLLQTKILPGLN